MRADKVLLAAVDVIWSITIFYLDHVKTDILELAREENHGPMTLDGISYSAFIHFCRVILYRMMNPTVVSLC